MQEKECEDASHRRYMTCVDLHESFGPAIMHILVGFSWVLWIGLDCALAAYNK